ncbi:MAG: HEAT repeat domain-containing protein, partial [Lentisphaeraceae bacterium]|nr:HEAT repeat domain-containing protein [Lentisphaeraceae bacterium]
MCRLLLILLMFSVSPLFAEKGEGKEIPKKDAGPEEYAKVALSSRNPSVAICCFGILMENNKDMGSELTAETVIKFSKRRGLFHKAVGITSFFDIEPLIPNIKGYKEGFLAASILAAKAYQNLMYENIDMRGSMVDSAMEEDMKGKKKKKNKKKSMKNVGAPVELKLTIPEELFKSKDKATQYLAILAAAYSMQKEYADKVKAVRTTNGEIASAKILFQVMTGETPADKDVKAAYEKSLRIEKPISGTPVYLSEIDMNVPAFATLCEALGRTANKKYLGVIHKALESKDERVRIDAVRALRKIGDKTSLPYLYKAMQKCEWTQLIEICHFLGENPVKESVPHLINRFKNETGRFRLDVNYALSSIRGKKEFYKEEQWEEWWKANAKDFKVDLTKTIEFRSQVRLQDAGAVALGGFYSISIYSDRCCFVVDYSLSMKDDKIKSLKENMNETVENLRDYVEFNICDFGGDVNLLYDGTLIDDKRKALKYIDSAPLTGGTRSMDAIERGMMIPSVDTICFLS